ncbi:MAG: pyridoxal phosphate-dependent aminotransferase [Phycisphaerales bacterium]|nr:pyridoxal phosphate-dependent aminotransferase [Phycisphaerales bacterium]
MRLAERVRLLKGSATLAVTARANALRAEGVDVIGFGAGEPDFDTPEMVKAAAITALHEGKTRYAPTPGIPDLRAAVADRMSRHNGIDCQAADVVVTVGAKHAVFEVMQCLVEPGDEVVVLTPAWLSYRPMVEVAGGTIVEVAADPDHGFRVRPEQLQAAMTDRTVAVVLNSPCNPTGVTYPPGEVEALAEVVMSHPSAMLVSDEIYEDLIYPEVDPGAAPYSPASNPAFRDRTVTVNGLSKSMAMTGWRIGWICAPGFDGALAKAVTRLQSHMTSGIPGFCMQAALVAIEHQPEESSRMRAVFVERAKLVHELLSDIPRFRCVPPSGAFYAFPDVSGCFGLSSPGGEPIASAGAFAEALLEAVGVAVVPGEDFGEIAKNHVRISFACDEATIREGLARIAKWVGSLEG